MKTIKAVSFFLGVLSLSALTYSHAGAFGLGDVKSKVKGEAQKEVKEVKKDVGVPTSGGSTPAAVSGGGNDTPYLKHRQSLVPYTGLGATPVSTYWDSAAEAKAYLEPLHEKCHVNGPNDVLNKSNYKVWPSHKQTIVNCTKVLQDADGPACYVIKADCKKILAGEVEPKPGEWGPEYNRCDTTYDSSFRWQQTCPASF